MTKLLQALRNSTARLAAEFEDSKLFEHSGTKGQFRERIIGQLLRPFLPYCYGIGSGQVFSDDGQSSDQIDIVLYDAIFSNVLFRGEQNSLFPCESVYGTVEVKSELNTDELIKSVDNIASVKKLPRAASTMLNVLPFRAWRVGEGLTASETVKNPYLGIVFAYRGLTKETAWQVLTECMASQRVPPDQLPDFVFCHERGYMISKTLGDKVIPLGGEFDRYSWLVSGSDTLPLFFYTLNVYLNDIVLKAPDYEKYWVQLVNELSQKSG